MGKRRATEGQIGGLAGWVLKLFLARFGDRRGQGGRQGPRLKLVERVALAPRQSLALVEAEGRCFLVATSAEGEPAFYALDKDIPAGRRGGRRTRISW